MRSIVLFLSGLCLYSCSSSILQRRERVYRAPAMGAESRFEEGLKREKRPQQLFSKKEQREMAKMGMISEGGGRYAPVERISAAKADSMLYGIKPDSTKATDSTAVPAALPDSTNAPKKDSAH